jgi:hypothetical protein
MNSMIPRLRALLVFLVSALAAPAQANLSVHPMRLPVQDGRAGQIRVYSQTGKVQYVQTRVLRLEQPGTPDEAEVALAPGNQDGVVVTPARFVLASGGNRLVRVIPLQSVTQETAYRVYVEGVPPPHDEHAEGEGDASTANVGVSLVWGALVHVIPAQPLPDMRIDGADLHNIGNVRLGVTAIKACTAANQCTEHSVERSLYPGARMPLPFDPAGVAQLTVSYRLSYLGYKDHHRTLAP